MADSTLAQLRHDVATAGRVVAPSWPLSSVIAVNPLSGLEGLPFAEALHRAETLFGTRGHLTPTEFRAAFAEGRVTRPALGAALRRAIPSPSSTDEEHLLDDLLHDPGEPAPHRTVLTAAERHDREHGTGLHAEVDLVASEHCLRLAAEDGWQPAPSDADPAQVLLAALTRLGVTPEDRVRYLEAHVAALPGWSAHLRWRDEQHRHDALLGYLAVRVATEAALLAGRGGSAPAAHAAGVEVEAQAEPTTPPTRLRSRQRALVWLDAYERCVHDPLLAALGQAETSPLHEDLGPALVAHVVCCIDVRSEGLRRHLEAAGPYATYGYAGFFGLPVHIDPLTGGAGTDQCPVLLRPSAAVAEVATPGNEGAAARVVEQHRRVAAAGDAWRAAKYHPIAPLALAEAAGWPAGALAAARTAAPGFTAWVADRLPRATAPIRHDRSALSLDAQAGYVAAIWKLGMASHAAPLVVLCGHTSRSDNNPMESALACGACGGNPGGANARVAAAMANDPAVRERLASYGVDVPASTWFVAAEHDTGTDVVTLLDIEAVPASHQEALDRLRRDLARAGDRAAAERAATLPGSPPARRGASASRRVRRRGRDWAEPVPELGLAGNMAFVVGPRALTRHLDLGRRVFLHSYDAATDPDGATLAGILTAPLVVAQWINAQYYFSTTDPELLGAGSKAMHNPVGDLGVLSGPGGDLRRGLALQSVRAGSRLLHEPVRLLAVVEGRLDHIDAAIAGSTTLQQLVGNEWMHLVARQGPAASWQQRTASGWIDRLLEIVRPTVGEEAACELAG